MGILIFLGALIGFVALSAAFALPGAWILMLLLGAFAHVSHTEAAALNFWSCYIIVVIISLFIGKAAKK